MKAENKYTIRLATEMDFEEISSIWLLNIKNDYEVSADDIKNNQEVLTDLFLTRRDYYNFWVTYDNFTEKIIGWQSYFPIFYTPLKKGTAVESSTYIHPDYHKTGIAYEMMNYALLELKKSDIYFVYGFVNKYNQGAIKLVNKIGFFEVGTLPAFPSIFPYFYEKILYVYIINQ